MTWVGPETITSLIEAHGTDRGAMLRPAWHGDAGLAGARADRPPRRAARDRARPDAARRHRRPRGRRPDRASSSWATRASIFDVDTPEADLPPYEGPPDPPAGHTHEWGADVTAEAGCRIPRPQWLTGRGHHSQGVSPDADPTSSRWP